MNAPRRLPNGMWEIASETDPTTTSYVVDLKAGSCTCPHWKYSLAGTGRSCKHMRACQAAQDRQRP